MRIGANIKTSIMFKKLFHHENKAEKVGLIIINISRFLFVALIIFELLNYLKILSFTLDFTWLGLIITALASLVLLEFTAFHYRKRKGHHLHWSIWLIVLAGVASDAAGDIFHFYSKYGYWDQIVHFLISVVTSFTLFIVFNAFWIDKFKFSLLFSAGRFQLSLFLAATTTMTLSVLYEIEEYVEDLIFHTHRLGPGTDTANDLLFNLLGVAVIVVYLSLHYLVTHKRKVLE